MTSRMRSGLRRRRARGAVSILVAILIATIGLTALVSIDIGNLFFQQRNLQRIADMAALAGAQQLRRGAPTAMAANVLAATRASATQNAYTASGGMNCAVASGADMLSACIGVWDPAYVIGGDTARHFNSAYNAALLQPNAVRVQVTKTVPYMFLIPAGSSRQLHAEAIASGSPPVASFSLGSGLLDVQTANSVLSGLLGNTVSLSAVSWQGLVDARVSLGQLLKVQASVGTVEELLNLPLSLTQFYTLILTAASQQSLLNAVLGSPPTTIGANAIQTGLTLGKVLDLGVLAPAKSSAAEVGMSVAQLLTLAAQVARGTSAVDLTSQLALGPIGSKLSVTLVQPPVMASGPALQTGASTWATTANTSQTAIDLILKATTDVLGLSSLASVQVTLPVRVEVAKAKADLTTLRCSADRVNRTATVRVATSSASICLSNGAGACTSAPVPIASASVLLGTVSVAVTGQIDPNKVSTSSSSTPLTMAIGDSRQTSSPKPLGDLVSDLVGNLTLGVKAKVLFTGIEIPLVSLDKSLLINGLVSLLGAPLLNNVLAALGIQLATANVWMQDIDCNNTNLVF